MASTTPLTTGEAKKFDNSAPAAQVALIGTRVKEAQADVQILEVGSLAVQRVDIAADASGALSFVAQFSGQLVDIVLRATATSGSGTVTLRRATTAISDAIVAAVDLTLGRAATLTDLGVVIVAGETLNLITAGANDRAEVYLVMMRSA